MWRNSSIAIESYSLSRRLLVRLFALLLALAAGLFFFVSAYAERAADGAFDRLLLASALAVADAVRVQDGRIAVDLPYAALSILAQSRRDRIFYRIGGPDGAAVTGYADLPAGGASGLGDDQPRFFNAQYRGMAVRLIALRHPVALSHATSAVEIVVAQTRESRGALARDIFANAFVPIILAVLAGAGLIAFGVRQALAPLGALERVISARPDNDFSPIAAPAPREVSQLVAAINRSMARVKDNLDTMQVFLADAAHQIRTPLASLRAQAEVAAEEEDAAQLRPMVERIRRNAVQASQLATQLLNYAMVVHRGEARSLEPVDLGALTEQAAQRAQIVAEQTDIVFAADLEGGAAAVLGDAVSLREALANLLDNAVKYGGAGRVDAVLRRAPGGGVRLEIADRGPGIPEHEKAMALQRFGRGAAAAGAIGSGLGLAIVDSVMQTHGASLFLLDRDGGGLLVRIDFPPLPAEKSPGSQPGSQPGSRPGSWSGGAAGRRRAAAALCLAAGLAVGMARPAPAAAEPSLSQVFDAPAGEGRRLTIRAATDLSAMAPLIADFQLLRPDVTVHHIDMSTAELYAHAVAHVDDPQADLLISSAADLQVKLVNDGLTRPHVSPATAALPDWANWRDEAFGFTFEPVVMVYNTDKLSAAEAPRSRDDLAELLRRQPDRFKLRVATYDASASGVGYLLASLDSILYSAYWRLVTMLGAANTRLYCCSGDILDAVERGDALIGYNVLGSYARARVKAGAPVGMVFPAGYTLVAARVAVIPRNAPQPQLAAEFIDYLLSDRGQRIIAGPAALYAISATAPGDAAATGLREAAGGTLRPIGLSPSLLVFLDAQKRERFLQLWLSALQLP